MVQGLNINNSYENYNKYPIKNTVAMNKNGNNTSVPQFKGELKQDTVSLSTQKSKQNKTALTLGGIGLVVVGTLLIAKGKVGNKTAQQLAEQVKFKPAKTMEEANKFAIENFGMKLEFDDNLFAANLINDISTTINNKMRGKAKFPKKACFISEFDNKAKAAYNPRKDILKISKIANGGTYGPKSFDSLGLYNKLLIKKHGNNYTELIKKYNNDLELKMLKETLFHEFGHVNHVATCKDAIYMLPLNDLKTVGRDSHLTESFLKEVQDNEVIKKFCSKYALTAPTEFIADIFAYKMMGKQIPKEVEELYVKYGGPVIN